MREFNLLLGQPWLTTIINQCEVLINSYPTIAQLTITSLWGARAIDEMIMFSQPAEQLRRLVEAMPAEDLPSGDAQFCCPPVVAVLVTFNNNFRSHSTTTMNQNSVIIMIQQLDSTWFNRMLLLWTETSAHQSMAVPHRGSVGPPKACLGKSGANAHWP